MSGGRSRKTLVQKLEIKSGTSMIVIAPPRDYWTVLGELPNGVSLRGLNEGSVNFIHLFVKKKEALEEQLLNVRRVK